MSTFNVWEIILPLFAVMVAVFGWVQYGLSEGRINRRFKDTLFGVVAVFGAVIALMLLFSESIHGVIQFFDDRMVAGENPENGSIRAVVTIFGAATLYGFILYGLGVFAGRVRLATLRVKRLKLKQH